MANSDLPTFRFPGGTCIAHAQVKLAEKVSLQASALSVMTDLLDVKAATIHPQVSLTQAEAKMIQHGVRMLFVTSDMSCIDGIVTVSDLLGPKPLRLIQQRQVNREDITVSDVMTALAELDAVEYTSLARATVSQVVDTLKKIGRHHLLAVENATPTTPARIRGVVSQTQIERQLGTALHLTTIATSFAEIEKALV